MKLSAASIVLSGLAACLAATTGLAETRSREDITVNARVFNGYTRTKLPDGTFKPESYAFGEGGCWDIAGVDKSVHVLSFHEVVETIAGPLRMQNYLPTKGEKETDLLILVFWGVTSGVAPGEYSNTLSPVSDAMREVAASPVMPGEAANSDANRKAVAAGDALDSALLLNRAENQLRDQNNAANARILGYTEAYRHAAELEGVGFTLAHDVVQELEANRYFVVLQAYDFSVAWKEKKRKLLWETRFSIEQHGNKFNEQLLAMTLSAARHFGGTTDGLIRQNLPEGKVEVGTPRVVEPVTTPNPEKR